MPKPKARLTIDLDPRMHAQLKVVAARKGTTMRSYTIRALEHGLENEPEEYLTAEEAQVLAELWDNPDDAIYDEL